MCVLNTFLKRLTISLKFISTETLPTAPPPWPGSKQKKSCQTAFGGTQGLWAEEEVKIGLGVTVVSVSVRLRWLRWRSEVVTNFKQVAGGRFHI